MKGWQLMAMRAAQRWSYAFHWAIRLNDRLRRQWQERDPTDWREERNTYFRSIRKRKRQSRIMDDGNRMRDRSIRMAHADGVTAEEWQDFFYGELQTLGVNPPGGVRRRWKEEGKAI